MTKITNTQLAVIPYTLQAYLVATPPVASTTYYSAFGFSGLTSASETSSRVYFPTGGTIKQVMVWYRHAGTNGTTETSTISLRINNTTDTTIATGITTATSANNQLYTIQPNIAVSAGDFFTLKWPTPAWVTAPGQPAFWITLLIA